MKPVDSNKIFGLCILRHGTPKPIEFAEALFISALRDQSLDVRDGRIAHLE